MIEVSELSYSYGPRMAIEGLHLKVARGAFLGIVGPNSAGKSTLLRLLSGALQPQQGVITLEDRPLPDWSLRERARTIAVVSAENDFAFPFTVRQIILMGRAAHRPHAWRDYPVDEAVAAEAMEATETSALRDRSVQTLSSGERQRVLLARALAQRPRLLLLDEPSAHLDIGHEWSLFELLRRLHRERHLTVVCTLHDLPLAARFCDRLVVLHQGKTRAEGKPTEVVTAELLQDVFHVDADVRWSQNNVFLTPISRRERISS